MVSPIRNENLHCNFLSNNHLRQLQSRGKCSEAFSWETASASGTISPCSGKLGPISSRAGDNDSLPPERRADLAQRMAVYAGMVTGMDRNIGRLLADLRAALLEARSVS